MTSFLIQLIAYCLLVEVIPFITIAITILFSGPYIEQESLKCKKLLNYNRKRRARQLMKAGTLIRRTTRVVGLSRKSENISVESDHVSQRFDSQWSSFRNTLM